MGYRAYNSVHYDPHFTYVFRSAQRKSDTIWYFIRMDIPDFIQVHIPTRPLPISLVVLHGHQAETETATYCLTASDCDRDSHNILLRQQSAEAHA